jgi:hypothetical protein
VLGGLAGRSVAAVGRAVMLSRPVSSVLLPPNEVLLLLPYSLQATRSPRPHAPAPACVKPYAPRSRSPRYTAVSALSLGLRDCVGRYPQRSIEMWCSTLTPAHVARLAQVAFRPGSGRRRCCCTVLHAGDFGVATRLPDPMPMPMQIARCTPDCWRRMRPPRRRSWGVLMLSCALPLIRHRRARIQPQS